MLRMNRMKRMIRMLLIKNGERERERKKERKEKEKSFNKAPFRGEKNLIF